MDELCRDTIKFQSTLPLRGATWFFTTAKLLFQISIHTPLAGSDQPGVTISNVIVISIHTPLAGSDFQSAIRQATHDISIHTPLAGSDSICLGVLPVPCYFNPHSPCGERQQVQALVDEGMLISIHTPLAGSDATTLVVDAAPVQFQSTLPLRGATRAARLSRWTSSYFNPHSPCGERRKSEPRLSSSSKFQSTLPLRGATVCRIVFLTCVCYFNPHSPCGERHFCSTIEACTAYFNPHSPCGERHRRETANGETHYISIHTPLAGSDPRTFRVATWCRYFNPHSPCGERPTSTPEFTLRVIFQSTLPLRGATRGARPCGRSQRISIHTPLAGSDPIFSDSSGQGLHFNPHSPCGERPQK